ncbi:hypothetical protein FB45DRAFT_368170 [Roridomyces roridus]|uniref:Uncharacterized protein n=1 Tax=Roridomyces roridus TaxID=1738132 RepID=A0AAD7B454_9AGAR|nr:hypothetical protein FB45DRAFT_368170 [Roridomyces roridus]
MNFPLCSATESDNSFLSVLYAEMDNHKRQRRVMNPAFGAIRLVTEVFVRKANQVCVFITASKDKSIRTCFQLRDIWLEESGVQIDLIDGMRCMTLDGIGPAGFQHAFDVLDKSRD